MKNKLFIGFIILCIPLIGNTQDYNLRELLTRKQYATIIEHAGNLSIADSADYQTMNIIGQAYEGMLRYRDALRYYEHCHAMDTGNIDMLNTLARTAVNLGKATEAKQYFRKVLVADSTDFYANYQLARLYYQLGEYEEALEKYQYLLEQDENNPTLLKNEADCFVRLEMPLPAISSYFQAYSLNRENASLGSTLINAMLRIGGDFAAEALAVCDTVLSYNPGNRLLEQNKGMALYMNKKYVEADTLYSVLMEKGDSSYLTLKYGGASRYYAGQYFRSVEPLEAAYEKDTTSVEVCLLLGSALGKTFDRKRAYVLLDKAEEEMKPSPFLLNQLMLFRAETLQKDGRFDGAMPLYYQLWKDNPLRMDLLWRISTMYYVSDQADYQNEDTRQRGLFIYTLYASEFLKSGEDPVQLLFIRKLLESFYEDAFFRNVAELPMMAPDGKKSKISVIDLRSIINQITGNKVHN
ncbi:MAG: tetratricopeptide repeat protein [Tannerellaceae bacterium]|jgi:tetratricopeptide (TPR) repeat protein|nr:tetratricopeptide repeat protein [Tannerellaceae bacterium]